MPADPLAALPAKPLYEFSETEVGRYLDRLQAAEPDLRFLRARRAQS